MTEAAIWRLVQKKNGPRGARSSLRPAPQTLRSPQAHSLSGEAQAMS